MLRAKVNDFIQLSGYSFRLLIDKFSTIEGETIEAIGFGGCDIVFEELFGLVLGGGRVIGETFQCYLLLGHQLACTLIHLCIVYA